ncbi:MAG: pyridoxal phosphate-dependent aminotransferase, partial [Planctomycetota bacterium]
VAVPHPTYGLYDQLAAIQGAELIHLPWAKGWALPDLAATGARLVLLANPNNPSGTMVPREDLCALARSLDGILVVDEAYVDFADEPSGMLPLLAELPNLIVLRTFSKSFGLAAARLGLLFAHPALTTEFAKVKDSYNVGIAPQAMGLAALADPAHHAATVSRIREGRIELEHFCAGRGWALPPTQANFVLCRVGAQAGAIMRALRERDLLVRWFDAPELREYLRISVGTPDQQAALFAAIADCAP